MRLVWPIAVLGLLGAVACADKQVTTGADTAGASAQDVAGDAAPGLDTAGDSDVGPALDNPWGHPDCDPIHPGHCALPWPSSHHLQADAATQTGYRLRLGKTTLPVSNGQPIDPMPYERLDGFSVATSLLMRWPNLDASGLATEDHIELSVVKDAAIVWLEIGADGKVARHVPYFAELDAQEADPKKQALCVRPGVILKPATRYVIGVRALKDKAGAAFLPAPAFIALRDGNTAGTVLQARQSRFEEIFAFLAGEGVAKAQLLLAWDFTTASDGAIHGALLKMRKDAFAATGVDGPELKVTEVVKYSLEDSVDIAMQVSGTMHVPSFLKKIQIHGSDVPVLDRDADGMPVQNGWEDRPWYLRVPRVALTGKPMALLQYGHGLNGHPLEAASGYLGKIANDNAMMPYSAFMRGMSEPEVLSVVLAASDIDQIVGMFDKLQQGMIEWLMLQRAMKQRLAGLEVIQKNGIQIDAKQMYYFGNSQGGIYGGTVVALSQDVTRADLGVPGSNYSLLLQRSTDFDGFFKIIREVIPDTMDQAVLLQAIQLLWDSTDPVTHYRHLSLEPYPDTPSHAVLMDPAKGDHQVSVMSNEILARSDLGVKLMHGWGKPVALVAAQAFPYVGSGMVLWDFGTPWPLPGNVPPQADDAGPCGDGGKCKEGFECKQIADGSSHCIGKDPHELPRRSKSHTQQMMHFFHTGEIIDVCGGDGCQPD